MLNDLVRLFLLLVSFTLVSCYTEDDSKLVNAAASGDLEGIKSVLKNVSNINVKANDGWTALTISVLKEKTEVVEFLLNHEADINALEDGGNSPIYWAAFSGNISIVKLLLERGADINNKCPKCRLPIEIARIRGHQEIVKLLSDHDMRSKGTGP